MVRPANPSAWVCRGDFGGDTAADIPQSVDRHPPGRHGCNEVIENAIRDVFVKCADLAIAPEIEL